MRREGEKKKRRGGGDEKKGKGIKKQFLNRTCRKAATRLSLHSSRSNADKVDVEEEGQEGEEEEEQEEEEERQTSGFERLRAVEEGETTDETTEVLKS